MRTCAAGDCHNRFKPVSPIQLYCSKTCKSRETVRRFRSKRRGEPTPPPQPPKHEPRSVEVTLRKAPRDVRSSTRPDLPPVNARYVESAEFDGPAIEIRVGNDAVSDNRYGVTPLGRRHGA